MAIVTVDKNTPGLTTVNSSKNGALAIPSTPVRSSTVSNHIVARRKKLVWWHCGDLQSVAANSGAGVKVYYRFKHHTGHGYRVKLNFWVGIAMSTDASSSDPWCQWVEQGGSLETRELHYGKDTGTADHRDILWVSSQVSVAANTSYEWKLNVNAYCRVLGSCVWEHAEGGLRDSADGVVVPDAATNGAITENQYTDLIDATWDLWKHHASPLFQWSQRTDGSAEAIAGTTPRNMFDATTTPTTTTVGIRPQLLYRGRRTDAFVPVRMAVFGAQAAGTGGVIELRDSTNTPVTGSQCTGFSGSGSWVVVDFDLPATAIPKFDVYFVGGSTGPAQLWIRQICLYQWLA